MTSKRVSNLCPPAVLLRLLAVAITGLLVLGNRPVGAAVPLAASGTPQALLGQAWDEYGFMAFSRARELFQKADRHPNATAEQKFQARLGQAFITQFQLPGRDPDAARLQYEQLLAGLPADAPPAWRAVVLARIGQCLLTGSRPDYNLGRCRLREAIAADRPDGLAGQEAILQLLGSYLARPEAAEFRAGLAETDRLMPRLRGGPLECDAHLIAACLAFALRDYPRTEAEHEARTATGIENPQSLAGAYFQIARLNETVLNNPRKAARYYRILAEKCPASIPAFFARERAAELEHQLAGAPAGNPLSSTPAPLGTP